MSSDNLTSLKSIFAREEEVNVCGHTFVLRAPSAEMAAKIEVAQTELADHISTDGTAKMSKAALKANKAYNQLCIEAVLGVSADDAKHAMVVVPQLIEAVNDFMGNAPKISADPT